MKWPSEVMLIRHDTSAYNVLKDKKRGNRLYEDFKKAYQKDPHGFHTKELAHRVKNMFRLGTSDANTELADKEGRQAYATGKALSSGRLPHVIYVSPYKRTLMTLEHIKRGWPALGRVKTIEEERVREQDHGKALLYNDKRVFFSLNADERELEELQGAYWYKYPGGENISDVRARVRSFMSSLVNDYPRKRILVITHHLTILAFRAHMERLSAEEFIELDETNKPLNCSVTVYTGKPKEGKDGHLILNRYNQKLY